MREISLVYHLDKTHKPWRSRNACSCRTRSSCNRAWWGSLNTCAWEFTSSRKRGVGGSVGGKVVTRPAWRGEQNAKAERPRKEDRWNGVERDDRDRVGWSERKEERWREKESGRVGTLRKSGGAKPPFARARQQAGSPFRKAPPKPG